MKPNLFDKHIGKLVRRYTYALHVDGVYYQLMSIFENLEPDMSDKDAFPPNQGEKYLDRINNAGSPRVYVCVETMILTDQMCKEPWKGLKAHEESIPLHTNYDFSQIGIIRDHSIAHILPYRNCAAYVSAYKPKEKSDQLSVWLNNDKIRKQLTELSTRNFGFDICKYEEYIGYYIFVSYNPIYRSIHWKRDKDESGVFCEINFRNNSQQTLKFDFEGFDAKNNLLFRKEVSTNSKTNYFSFSELDATRFNYLKVRVLDEKNMLIDEHSHMCFIEAINLNMQLHEKVVRVQDEDGNVVNEYDKFSAVEPVNIGELVPYSSLETDPYAYRYLEESLDFVFIDGDKDGEHTNREKGVRIIKQIINSAKKQCFICDVYFGGQDFNDFILPIPSLNVKVNVLTSKLGLPKDTESIMAKQIQEYNKRIGGNVSIRKLEGDPILHDRLIIADEQVWMLGSSLNHFGAKATTIIRVPNEYRHRLIDKINGWWSSEKESKELIWEE